MQRGQLEAAPPHPVAITMAASPASQYCRREVSSSLAGGFFQGQVSLSADLLTKPRRQRTGSWGMEKHPAAEQPQAGDPQEKAGQAWRCSNLLYPRAQVLQGPAAPLPGSAILCEH